MTEDELNAATDIAARINTAAQVGDQTPQQQGGYTKEQLDNLTAALRRMNRGDKEVLAARANAVWQEEKANTEQRTNVEQRRAAAKMTNKELDDAWDQV